MSVFFTKDTKIRKFIKLKQPYLLVLIAIYTFGIIYA